MKQRKLFCDRNPVFYAISQEKGILLRHLRDLTSGASWATCQSQTLLPETLWTTESGLIKRGPGIDRNRLTLVRLLLFFESRRDGERSRPSFFFLCRHGLIRCSLIRAVLRRHGIVRRTVIRFIEGSHLAHDRLSRRIFLRMSEV